MLKKLPKKHFATLEFETEIFIFDDCLAFFLTFYNYSANFFLELPDILRNVSFTTSETEIDH